MGKCLEGLVDETIKNKQKDAERKKRVYRKLTGIKGNQGFLSTRRCQKCRKKHRNWRIEIKATAPVAKRRQL